MDSILEQAIGQVAADLAENGGGTYEQGTLLPFRPTTGFAVAVGGVTIAASAPLSVLGMLCRTVAGEYGESFVGTWLDGGTISIDAVRYFAGDQRASALLLGYQTGQKAIYDFGLQEDIVLGEEPVE